MGYISERRKIDDKPSLFFTSSNEQRQISLENLGLRLRDADGDSGGDSFFFKHKTIDGVIKRKSDSHPVNMLVEIRSTTVQEKNMQKKSNPTLPRGDRHQH